ncbi:MAG: dihydroorotate dehydrogenase [Thermoplasmata archaeon]|nr:dihydroorotate dehydrogenase [Thermoplasmata archaeon]
MTELRAEVGTLTFRNPLLLASGIWGESGRSLLGAYEAGAGGVVSKSIGTEPRTGYPNPTVEQYGDWGFLNAMGLPNPGIRAYPEEIRVAREGGAPVVGSVFAPTAEEFAELAKAMEPTGVCAVELNLSCPHAKGLGSEIGQDPVLVSEVTRAVRRATKLPVWVKLTPNVADVALLAEAAERAGADAITAINTVRGLAIEPTLRRPVLANGLGGLSGPAIKPIGLACVWQIYERVKIPIVGVGGIRSGRDVIEYLLAGARAVQVGTAVATDTVRVFSRIASELEKEAGALGAERLSDLVGAAHPGPARG